MNDTLAFRRALWFGLIGAAVVGVLGAVIGGIAVGTNGVVSALIGAAAGAVFASMSAGTMILAVRLTRHDPANPMFFAIVLAGWIGKFAVFVLIMVLLRDQPFSHRETLLVCSLAAVILSVVGDIIAVLGTRQAYVDAVTEASVVREAGIARARAEADAGETEDDDRPAS